MWKEIAQGGPLDLYSGMRYYDQFIPEGSRVLCRFNLRRSLSPTTVNTLEQKMKDAGVKDVKVTTGSPILNVQFTKGFPWLATVVAAVLIIAVLIISWKILIWIEEVAPGGTKLVLWGALAFIGVLLISSLRGAAKDVRKDVKSVSKAIKGGSK